MSTYLKTEGVVRYQTLKARQHAHPFKGSRPQSTFRDASAIAIVIAITQLIQGFFFSASISEISAETGNTAIQREKLIPAKKIGYI
jgi:hypothetical protein